MNAQKVFQGYPATVIKLGAIVSCIALAVWSHHIGGAFAEPPEFNASEAPGVPGGSLSVEGEFVDVNSSGVYQLTFNADEDDSNAGVGSAFLYLRGPALTACDVHGPAAEPGITPLPSVTCGGSYGMSVAIDDCLAKVGLHGYLHSDHPHVTFIGLTCMDLVLEKVGDHYEIKITLYTPKGPIILAGTVTGDVSMDTCPSGRHR
jgi:hypothetical protein